MDNYRTLTSNISTTQNNRIGTNNRLTNDSCVTTNNGLNLTAREYDSNKPIKYITQNFFNNNLTLDRGIFSEDGFGVPSSKIVQDTSLRFASITNPGLSNRSQHVPLPTTGGMLYGQGIPGDEYKLTPEMEKNLKTCNPRDFAFQNRVFTIFSNNMEVPNSNVNNYVQRSYGYYMGENSRRINKYS